MRTFHHPIDPSLSGPQLNKLLTVLQPKRLICPHSYIEDRIITSTGTSLVDTVFPGQTLVLSEAEIGRLKYTGLCPVALANLIKQKRSRISRVNGLEIEFADQKYQVKAVNKKQGD